MEKLLLKTRFEGADNFVGAIKLDGKVMVTGAEHFSCPQHFRDITVEEVKKLNIEWYPIEKLSLKQHIEEWVGGWNDYYGSEEIEIKGVM